MNNLVPVDHDAPDAPEGGAATESAGDAWHLPRHAHIVVYDQRERELLTIYDCGAAQKPPSAQLLGNLVRIKAEAERRPAQTGYTVSLREPAVLFEQSEGHYVVEPAE